MRAVTITSFKLQPSGWYVFKDSAGRTCATKDLFKASLAKQSFEQRKWVHIEVSSSGWHYLDVVTIAMADAPAPNRLRPVARASDESVCAQSGGRCHYRWVTPMVLKCDRPSCGHIKSEDRYGHR